MVLKMRTREHRMGELKHAPQKSSFQSLTRERENLKLGILIGLGDRMNCVEDDHQGHHMGVSTIDTSLFSH